MHYWKYKSCIRFKKCAYALAGFWDSRVLLQRGMNSHLTWLIVCCDCVCFGYRTNMMMCINGLLWHFERTVWIVVLKAGDIHCYLGSLIFKFLFYIFLLQKPRHSVASSSQFWSSRYTLFIDLNFDCWWHNCFEIIICFYPSICWTRLSSSSSAPWRCSSTLRRLQHGSQYESFLHRSLCPDDRYSSRSPSSPCQSIFS